MDASIKRRSGLRSPSESLKAGLIIAALTLATRAWIFGNPVVGIDEQFYLLAGNRLLDGVLPYVDIGDRKPIGLFLIYAAAGKVFPDPVIGYQLLSALSVALTSWLLFTIARRLTSFAAALAGAAAYPAWLLVFAGVSGQSPTYYNLPMAAGAAMLLRIIAQHGDSRLTVRGCAIMLLAGTALQIKYAAVFDGIFFGLSLLWAGRMRGWSLARLAGNAMIWILCALVPTLAAWATYVAIGHGDAFVQANFLSVFGDINSALNSLARLIGLNIGLSPFWICLWIAWKHRQDGPIEARWIMAWAAASFAGFLLFGVYYDHYVLPLLLPLCLAAALAFDRIARRRLAMALVIGLGLAGGFGRAIVDQQHYGNGDEAERLAALVRPHLGTGCLYVNEEIPILYWLTNSCLPTRYAFPEHLVLYRYEHAIGVDQLGELRQVFARRPSVIVKSTSPDDDTRPASRALLEARLQQNYRLVGRASVGAIGYEVYALAKPR